MTDEALSQRLDIVLRLRHARMESGLSQERAAKALNHNRDWIAKIEVGLRVVSPEELAALCRLYGADPRTILFGADGARETKNGEA